MFVYFVCVGEWAECIIYYTLIFRLNSIFSDILRIFLVYIENWTIGPECLLQSKLSFASHRIASYRKECGMIYHWCILCIIWHKICFDIDYSCTAGFFVNVRLLLCDDVSTRECISLQIWVNVRILCEKSNRIFPRRLSSTTRRMSSSKQHFKLFYQVQTTHTHTDKVHQTIPK